MIYFNAFVCYFDASSTLNISRFPGDSSFPVAIFKGFLANTFFQCSIFLFTWLLLRVLFNFLLHEPDLFSHCNRLGNTGDSSLDFYNISKWLQNLGQVLELQRCQILETRKWPSFLREMAWLKSTHSFRRAPRACIWLGMGEWEYTTAQSLPVERAELNSS